MSQDDNMPQEVKDAFQRLLRDSQLVTQQTFNYMVKRAQKKDASIPMTLMCVYLVAKKNYESLIRGEMGMTPEVARQMFSVVDQHFKVEQVQDGKPVTRH